MLVNAISRLLTIKMHLVLAAGDAAGTGAHRCPEVRICTQLNQLQNSPRSGLWGAELWQWSAAPERVGSIGLFLLTSKILAVCEHFLLSLSEVGPTGGYPAMYSGINWIVVGLSGGLSRLGGQHVATAFEGETDGCYQCYFRDEIPQSEKVSMFKSLKSCSWPSWFFWNPKAGRRGNNSLFMFQWPAWAV